MATFPKLRANPGNAYRITKAHQFAGSTFLFVYTYRPVLEGWYLDILDRFQSPIKEGIRLEAGGLITEGLLDFPYTLIVIGPEKRPVRREDLGDELFIVVALP